VAEPRPLIVIRVGANFLGKFLSSVLALPLIAAAVPVDQGRWEELTAVEVGTDFTLLASRTVHEGPLRNVDA
jgi:hypothetical protein